MKKSLTCTSPSCLAFMLRFHRITQVLRIRLSTSASKVVLRQQACGTGHLSPHPLYSMAAIDFNFILYPSTRYHPLPWLLKIHPQRLLVPAAPKSLPPIPIISYALNAALVADSPSTQCFARTVNRYTPLPTVLDADTITATTRCEKLAAILNGWG